MLTGTLYSSTAAPGGLMRPGNQSTSCEQIVLKSNCTEKRKSKWQMSHCLSAHREEKKTTKRFHLECVCKAFAAVKDINGLLLEMNWFNIHTHTATD